MEKRIQKRNEILKENYHSSLEALKELDNALKGGRFVRTDAGAVVYESRDGTKKTMTLSQYRHHVEVVENCGILSLAVHDKAKKEAEYFTKIVERININEISDLVESVATRNLS